MKDVKAGSEALLQEGPPATKRVRGLRDVMSSRKVAGRSVPATRSQQLSEIAWLDRELERLRREASIMEANLLRINARVAEVDDRRETILGVIRHDLGIELPSEAPVQPKAPRVEAEEPEFDEISLEY
jgi:hypothetical protein